MTEDEEEYPLRKHGAERSKKAWHSSTSHGKKLTTLRRRTVFTGAKMLPDVPEVTRGTKSKSKYFCRIYMAPAAAKPLTFSP